MTTRTVDRVDDWEEVPYEGGEDGLQQLSDRGFSGRVRTAGGAAYFLDGSVVGVIDGTLDTVADAAGTAYRAPSDALPLLAVMQERTEGPRAKYYTEDTPISDVDRRLSDAGFTGYIELSENVLSGDYYIVYHGGRSTSAAFVGASERLITDEEAFETADDEVGIFEVHQVDIDVQEVDAAGGTEPGAESGTTAGAAGPSSSGTTEPSSDGVTGPSSGRPGESDDATDPLDAGGERDERDHTDRDRPDRALDPLDAGRDDGGADRRPTEREDTAESDDQESAAPERDEPSDGPERTTIERDPLADPTETGDRPTREPTDRSGPESDDRPALDEDQRTDEDRRANEDRHAGDDTTGETRSPPDRERTERDDPPDRANEKRGEDRGPVRDDRQADTSDQHRSHDTSQSGQSREPSTDDRAGEDRSSEGDTSPRRSAASSEGRTGEGDASGRPETGPSQEDRSRESSTPRTETDTGESAAGPGGGERSRSDEDLSPEDLERRSIPSVDPANSESPSDDSGDPSTPTSGVSRDRPPASGAPSEQIRDLEAQIDERDRRIDDLESTVDRLREERGEYRSRIEELEAQLDELAAERDDLAEQLDSRPAESAGTGAAQSATRTLSADEALAGTNLFVRYASRGEATLEAAAEGSADRSAVTENLRLEHHTQFEADDVAVDGQPFDEFLESSLLYRFVSWLVEDLIYEIRDTGHGRALADLYEALPRIDRAELQGSVSVQVEVDGETSREQRAFDVVVRDRMGNPLIVADLNDDRDAATGAMMETLVTTATDVGRSHDHFAAGFLVTESYFDPEALETAADATGGGLFSRDSRESYVRLSRKDGFHLCLVEARDEQFHLAVPELKSS
ncbi:DUF7527 domain-containing protein [Halococcoides cellulosivorans]|uniref:DUF7527 domain-containing protein n=1 Tax=Halococcoides cellulosivorans TaxID=1679096 RepID=A0A2R4WXX2_9EURY|nr:hypothetical protein [Halococcoides cellulosivorans]AWB26389.1 hypothetical protein HARCEL1_00960 [Halococcoides cellulosivorans]